MSASWTITVFLLLVAMSCALHRFGAVHGFVVDGTSKILATRKIRPTETQLLPSWLDNLDFMRNREGDFVKLDETASGFGPGPLLVLYNVPETILDEELLDMVDDADPTLTNTIMLRRVNDRSNVLNLSLKEALSSLVGASIDENARNAVLPTTRENHMNASVILFSGISNASMMAIYNILGQEIFLETNRSPACAKAVPNAMGKSLRQVLTEIGDDHAEATQSTDR